MVDLYYDPEKVVSNLKNDPITNIHVEVSGGTDTQDPV